MGHYAKRFFGKAKGEPRDPDLVMTVDTSITASSTTARRYQFVLKAGDKDVIIDWGDGTINNYTATDAITAGRTYATAGIYQIRIAGSYPGFGNSGNYYNYRIVSLDNWGTNEFTDMSNMFSYAPNLIANYMDIPNTSKVTTFRSCFFNAEKFNGIVNFDTSNAVSLRSMFYNSGLLPQSFAHFNIEKLEPGTNTGLDIFMNTPTASTPLDMNEPGTTDNYDDTLISFASQNAPNGIVAHFGISQYSDRGKAAREALVAKGWTITDGGSGPSENDFIITVDTNLQYGGFSNTRIFRFDFSGMGYDCVVNWGDGTSTAVVGQGKATSHTYTTPGIYQIYVQGQMPRISHNHPTYFEKNKIISLDNWGNSVFDTCKEMFSTAINMEANYTDIPNTSNVSDFSNMFYHCFKFNGKIEFDMNNAVNTDQMFYYNYIFNQYVDFDSPLLKSCNAMFNNCIAFNQPINFLTRPVEIEFFLRLAPYKHSLANWNIELLRGHTNPLYYSVIVDYDINEPGTTDNYDDTLISWGNQNNTYLGGIEFTDCKYSSAGKVGRDKLIAKGWRIKDGGMI